MDSQALQLLTVFTYTFPVYIYTSCKKVKLLWICLCVFENIYRSGVPIYSQRAFETVYCQQYIHGNVLNIRIIIIIAVQNY